MRCELTAASALVDAALLVPLALADVVALMVGALRERGGGKSDEGCSEQKMIEFHEGSPYPRRAGVKSIAWLGSICHCVRRDEPSHGEQSCGEMERFIFVRQCNVHRHCGSGGALSDACYRASASATEMVSTPGVRAACWGPIISWSMRTMVRTEPEA
jgi:hypothetical protein